MSQHGSDVGHVFNDIVRDVSNPLGQRLKIDWFDDLQRLMMKQNIAGRLYFTWSDDLSTLLRLIPSFLLISAS